MCEDARNSRSWSDRRAEKTAKQTTDIILYDHKVIVFKMESDVMLYVVGGPEENEVLLYRYAQRACAPWHRALTHAQCCPCVARLAQHPPQVSAATMSLTPN